MIQFENPIQFNIKKKIGNNEIVYSKLIEISQGGPEIGTMCINGKQIESYRFGGPFLSDNEYLFAPVFIRKFLGSGFKLAKINLQTLEVKIIGKTKNLIFLDKIENGQVYFFEDSDKTVSGYYTFKNEMI